MRRKLNDPVHVMADDSVPGWYYEARRDATETYGMMSPRSLVTSTLVFRKLGLFHIAESQRRDLPQLVENFFLPRG